MRIGRKIPAIVEIAESRLTGSVSVVDGTSILMLM